MARLAQDQGARSLVAMREALARQIAAHAPSEGENPTVVDGLVLFRHTERSACHPAMCEPSLSVFVQ